MNLWQKHAHQWSFVRPPLRPSAEDIDMVGAAVAEWTGINGQVNPSVLVLGVTPELCRLPLNSGSRIIAADNSADMIRALWPGSIRPRDEAICSDWRSLPLAANSIHLVLGDGTFSMLPYPAGYAALCAELRRVLRSQGRCVIRCFTQLEKRETLEEVLADLDRGRIGNFHILKWRLAMAWQSDADAGVSVGEVWNIFHETWKDFDALAKRYAWPIEELRTIEVYRGMSTRYTFPTLAQYHDFFPTHGFHVIKTIFPAYELGGRCPTLVLDLS